MNLNMTEKQISEGRQRVRDLLPKLRKEVSLSQTDMEMRPNTHVGQSLMSRIRFDSIDALVIRRSVRGWHADVLLTGLPRGVSNVMGTPEAHPLPTREEALEAGTEILRQLCRLSLENEFAVRDTPFRDIRPFDLHGYVFKIPGEMVDRIGQVWAAIGTSLVPDASTARAHLRTNLVLSMGEDRFDPEIFSALPEEEKTRLAINMATLLQFGEFRYPERPVAEPVEEDFRP